MNGVQVTLRQFQAWLGDSLPGDQLCYHIGHLAADRLFDAEGEWMAVATVDSVAFEAYASYERGYVELVQKRQAPGVCRYYAVKRRYQRRP